LAFGIEPRVKLGTGLRARGQRIEKGEQIEPGRDGRGRATVRDDLHSLDIVGERGIKADLSVLDVGRDADGLGHWFALPL
jgi:hypothetical protein